MLQYQDKQAGQILLETQWLGQSQTSSQLPQAQATQMSQGLLGKQQPYQTTVPLSGQQVPLSG